MRKKILERLLALQKRLKPLTEAQKRWAHSHYTKCAVLKRGGAIWCHCCGYIHHQLPGVIDIDLECGGQCPECGAVLELEQRRGTMFKERYYLTFTACIDGWQVFRTFLASRVNIKGMPTSYGLNEIYQNWISPEGEEHILSVSYSRTPWTEEKWDASSPLDKPRKHNGYYSGYFAYNDMFDVKGNFFYPRLAITPILKRNGWSKVFLDMKVSPAEVCKALLRPEMEMIAKTQRALFVYAVRNQIKVPIHAVKICNRKGYCIEDPGVWLDYIENLCKLGLDTHNAHYVCPDDLHAAHECMVARLRKIREREEREKRRAEIAALEADYLKTKGKFFGICFGNESLVVTVIQSVADIEAEGRAMRHCVFENEYYKKGDSLILSAKDKEGNRVETIEVDVKTFKVVQSRGVCNQNTPHHEEIINLVNSNMNLIRQAI